MMAHHQLVASLHRDLWAYASMVLSDGARRDLEESCRKLAVAVPRVGPPPPVAPAAFCSEVRAARVQEGERFVHHAGYYAGGNAARRVEGNLPTPNAGALRLVAEAAAAFTDLTFESKAPSPARFDIAIISPQPLDRGAAAYARGFTKGAATRLNEGNPPVLREALTDGGKVWTATLDWVPRSARLSPLKGGGKTPRR